MITLRLEEIARHNEAMLLHLMIAIKRLFTFQLLKHFSPSASLHRNVTSISKGPALSLKAFRELYYRIFDKNHPYPEVGVLI